MRIEAALCRETQGIPVWHKDEIEQRIARLASGEEPTSAWEEVKKRIREQAGAALYRDPCAGSEEPRRLSVT